MDKRIYLPEGNGSKLMKSLNISRSQMDLALKGNKMGVKNYNSIRTLAKNCYNGLYKVCISGAEFYLPCQQADALLEKVHTDYFAVSKLLEHYSNIAKETKVLFAVCA